MGAVFPAGMYIGMTLHAVVVHHQRVGWDVVAGGGAGERWLKVFGAFLGALRMPVAGVLGMQADHCCDRGGDKPCVAQAQPPANLWAHEAVQPVEPDGHHRRDHMRPVRQAYGSREASGDVGSPQAKEQPA